MLNLVQVKRDYFDAKAAQDIPVIWREYFRNELPFYQFYLNRHIN